MPSLIQSQHALHTSPLSLSSFCLAIFSSTTALVGNLLLLSSLHFAISSGLFPWAILIRQNVRARGTFENDQPVIEPGDMLCEDVFLENILMCSELAPGNKRQ